jgi:hypothetical protein
VILEPNSATLVAPGGRAPFWRRDQGSTLVMDVGLPHHAGIWLGDEERSFAGEVTLSIRAAASEHIDIILKHAEGRDYAPVKEDVAGSARFTAAKKASEDGPARKASITFEAFVPAKFMGSIVGMARKGRFPRKVWVDVRGLGYRTAARQKDSRLSWPEPDRQPVLPITDVSFEFPLHPQRDFQLIHAEGDHTDAETAEKAASAQAMRRVEPFLFRVSAPLFWVVWISVALVVGLALFLWQ